MDIGTPIYLVVKPFKQSSTVVFFFEHSSITQEVNYEGYTLQLYYGHLLVITGYTWDDTCYKWGYKYL
jgi:hypothetical protein